MTPKISFQMAAEILRAAELSLSSTGSLNIPVVAEQVRQRNASENVAVEDIEMAMLQIGRRLNAPIEFDRYYLPASSVLQ